MKKEALFYIGCSGDLYWAPAKANTLVGAMREATKTCQVQACGKMQIAIKTDYGYEEIAVKHSFDKWTKY